MSNLAMREIGRLKDIYSAPLAVAIHHGHIGVGNIGKGGYWLTVEQADELAALLITALWQAGGSDA